jgi:branched-chain amino acid transport system ATP-binding protein
MSSLLRIEDLHVSYGSIAALRGVNVAVERGELVAILGPNGAGKSTLLRTVVGLNQPRHGSIRMNDVSIVGRTPERLVAEGVSLVPEGRHIFGALTVEQNLRLGATTRTDGRGAIASTLEGLLELFPILRERYGQRAGQLSGGEQQMLAIARALMTAPKLLLLDEPSLGLAPLMVRAVYDTVVSLRQTGLSLLVVEQNIQLALKVADRAYVLNSGQIAASGPSQDLRALPDLHRAYFGAVA